MKSIKLMNSYIIGDDIQCSESNIYNPYISFNGSLL